MSGFGIPAVEWQLDKERRFRMIILAAADSIEELRPQDVFRVLTEADNAGIGREFRRWLSIRSASLPLKTVHELLLILRYEKDLEENNEPSNSQCGRPRGRL